MVTIGLEGHRDKSLESVEWFTPLGLINSLGEFDLDPCTSINRPWDTAKKHYTISDDGLSQPWEGRVWLNPPYGRETVKWLEKLSRHGNGIALVFARVETNMFFKYVWGSAHGILFLKGRVPFYKIDGTLAGSNGGAASVLIAYGEGKNISLMESSLKGKYISLKR